MKKKILIVGKNGFIGRNLNEYLQKQCCKYKIVAVGSRELNILDEEQVRQFLEEGHYDVIIHAAIYNPRVDTKKSEELELENDLRMFYNFERNQELFGKMLYFGSGAEYDKSSDIIGASEVWKGNGIPQNAYGFSKYIINKQILNSKNIYNLRIFGLFGKYENWKKTFISGSCCKAIKNIPITIRKNVWFDYLYIDDFCRIVEWFINYTPKYQDYNVVTGKSIDLLSIAKTILKVSNKELPIYVCEQGLAKEYTASNERLLEEVGEFSFMNIEDAIKCLYEWYESNSSMIDMTSLLYQ